MKHVLIGGAALAASTLAAGAALQNVSPHPAPTGATIEPSGFATIERAPSPPYPESPPPAEYQPRGEDEWYARDLGISLEEARERRREQEALRPAFEKLVASLRAKEAGNFTAPRIVHAPDWSYELYFKRDPQATLARYTTNPRFVARHAPYSREELEALMKPWTERFSAHNIAGGWGSDDTHGTAEIMMLVTEDEYRAIAEREGWGPVPAALKLGFAKPLPHPPVKEGARPFIRSFPQSSRSTGMQLLAGFTGRIVIRDGCLRVGSMKGAPLAYFHRETGIGTDEQGYLALTDRASGKSKGRIGEWFSWAGPNGVSETDPAVVELRARCGDGLIEAVGNPESLATFRARPNLVDSIALDRRVSRQRAWEWLKQCWARQEAQNPDKPPIETCPR